MILRELFAWCWQVGILHLLISIFSLSLWDIFPILSSVVYYCEVFYLFWVQCLSQWLGCNFLIVEGVLPVAGVLHGQNLVQHHGKPGHSECLWWGSIPGEQHWRCNPTPPHFTSKKKCSELKDCQVKKFNYSLTSTFFSHHVWYCFAREPFDWCPIRIPLWLCIVPEVHAPSKHRFIISPMSRNHSLIL